MRGTPSPRSDPNCFSIRVLLLSKPRRGIHRRRNSNAEERRRICSNSRICGWVFIFLTYLSKIEGFVFLLIVVLLATSMYYVLNS